MTESTTKPALPNWIAEHTQLYLRDPEKGHLWDSSAVGGPGVLPTLLLYTKGRKSGQIRPLPLIYGKSGDKHIIIASKGGAPDHPGWYQNLVKEPHCEIQVASKRHKVVARTASGAEREAMWQQLAVIYPPYNDYQAATKRQIPVVVLEAVG
jgi:deazaflavin-dependent oxidoreductase (nitroreductase family)